MKFVSEPITKVGPNEPVVIANTTTSKLSVATGLVFYESGRYDISIQGNVVTVSKAPSEWPEAKWEWNDDEQAWFCSNCKACLEKEDVQRHYFAYCYHCGKHMKIEQARWRRDENIPTLYECDPEKNIYCSKEWCYINGGECHETTCIEFEKKNEDIIDALCQVGEGYPITKEEIEHGTDIKTEER